MDPATLFRVVNPPALAAEIAALRDACGPLPASYAGFLGLSDGAEWCRNDHDGDCLALWGAGEIAELNEAYSIPHYLPEFLAIGSDGGDDAIGFDRAVSSDPERWPIVRIGFGNLDRADFVRLAQSFWDWWLCGCSLHA